MDKNAGAYSLQIYDSDNRKKGISAIVRRNTEGPPIPDWQ